APLNQIQKTRITNPVPGGDSKDAGGKAFHLQAVSKEERTHEQKAAQQVQAASQARRQTESRLLSEGSTPVKPTDKPKTAKLELPKRTPTPAAPAATPPAPAAPAKPQPATPPKGEPTPAPK